MTQERRPRYDVWLASATLVVVNVVVGWVIGAHGDFPLSDDWAYAWPVRSLCESGKLELLPWSGASCLVQMWYGAVLCKVFGFSFEVLRVSTLILGIAADIGVYAFARVLGVSATVSLFAALVFALSPLRVNLGFTFMTDVPFTAFAIWGACAYAAAVQRRNIRLLLIGAVLAAVASLVRQHGAFLAAAAALVLLAQPWNETDTVTARIRRACIAVAPSVLALGAYYAWLLWTEALPEAVLRKVGEARPFDLLTLGNLLFRAIEYFGLLLLPLAVACRRHLLATVPIAFTSVTALLAAAATFLFFRENALMPYLPSIIHDGGLGTMTLRDTLFLGLASPGAIGPTLRWPLTVVSTIAAGVVVPSWLVAVRRSPNAETTFAAMLLLCMLAGSLLHSRFYFDRYLLPLQPAAIVLTAIAIDRLRGGDSIGIAAWFTLAVMAAYSVAGTHDYLAWNRARFSLLDELTAAGITPRRIDGGVEFNAWHLAKVSGHSPSNDEVRVGHPESEKSWWWVVDDEYVVSMHPLAGYEPYSAASYATWLPPGRASVVVSKRSDSTPHTVAPQE